MNHFDLPLIAILRGITPDEVIDHAKVLLTHGFTLLEVPTNSPNWQKSVTLLRDYCGANALVGAGTVTTHQLLQDLLELKGQLMVTPNTDPELIRTAKQHRLTTCIGAFTPSEIFRAIHAGADIVKIFPVSSLGVNYVKALTSVVPKNTPLYAVGGVTPDNLADYLEAGCSGAGLGSDLYKAGQSVVETADKAQKFANAYAKFMK